MRVNFLWIGLVGAFGDHIGDHDRGACCLVPHFGPRATILSALSGNGLCALASSQGVRILTSPA